MRDRVLYFFLHMYATWYLMSVKPLLLTSNTFTLVSVSERLRVVPLYVHHCALSLPLETAAL